MDFAENWCSLLELFVSNAGLKLRMFMVDTILVKSGRVLGHFYTSKDGYICRFSAHEITRPAIYQRLAALHSLDPQVNPFGYIAVAHYSTGVSRLLKRAELQELMTIISGPYEFADPAGSNAASHHEQLFCIQAYIVPRKDIRYIASYDVQEGPLCTVLARRFSARYTNAMDDPGGLLADPFLDQEDPTLISVRPMSAIGRPGSALSLATALNDDSPGAVTLTAEELLVESQLVAMGLLEPRRQQEKGVAAAAAAAAAGAGAGSEAEDGGEAGFSPTSPAGAGGITSSLPAPRRIKDDVARLLQAASSFVERAHGQRIVGLVAEFIAAGAPTPGVPSVGGLVLMAVHAVQLDPRASRGRLGTFTERWTDYLEGLAPPPAPQAPGRRNQSPSMLRAGDASLVMTDRNSGSLVRTSAPLSPTGAGSTYGAPLNPQRQLLMSPPGAAGAPPSPRVHGGAGSVASSVAASSLTRIYSASPSAAHHRAVAALSDAGGRPGSAPASVVKVGRHVPNSAHSSASNGHYTLRNAISAARAGGGGNPTAAAPAPDSYNLWLSREGGPTESMAARLALEVESLRERLQRQTDISVRAEAALQQLAGTSRRETMELSSQIEELRMEVGRLGDAKRNLAVEYDRLRTERLGLQAGRSELGLEVDKLRSELAGERETLARAVRDATAREEQLEAQLRTAREEREDALKQLGGLRRRVEEESEVVEALRGQLYDYKQLVAQLQAQVRRGRNNKQIIQTLGGLPVAVPSSVNLLAGGLAGPPGADGGTASAPSRAIGRNTKDGEESDTETDAGGMMGDQAAGGVGGGGGGQGGGGKPTPGGGGGGGRGVGTGYGGRRPSNSTHHNSQSASQSPRHGRSGPSNTHDHYHHPPARSSHGHLRTTSPNRGSGGSPNGRSVTLAPPPPPSPPPAATTGSSFTAAAGDGGASGGIAMMLTEIRRARLAAGTGTPLSLDRAESGKDGPSGGGGVGGTGGFETGTGRGIPPISPTGSISGHAGGALVLAHTAGGSGSSSMRERQGVGLGTRKPAYELITAHDLFLLSWAKETLSPRMLHCHAAALQAVAAEEVALSEIFNFYGQLGQVVWLDARLTMNEKQFMKLAVETNVSEGASDEMKEVFKKLSDKTEFASDASANHPHPYINFEQFPETVLRLAALRYDWRPPENLEDAEEELYFASPPFMPPNPREQAGDDDNDPPPRPPEEVFLDIVKAYLKDDLLPRARRFRTAGSPQAKFRSQKRTAPTGLWLSSKSLSAGVPADPTI